MLHNDVCCANIASCYFVLPQEQEKCGCGGVGGGGGCCGACRAAGLPGRGPARVAPRGRQTRANPHELASNEECTRTCCGRACWNVAQTSRGARGASRQIYCQSLNILKNLCSVVERVQIGKALNIFDSLAGCPLYLLFNVFSTMSDDDIDNANLEQPEESEAAHFVWQYFAVTDNTDARKGGAKNAVCMFCDKSFSEHSTSRAGSDFLISISFNVADSSTWQALHDSREYKIC